MKFNEICLNGKLDQCPPVFYDNETMYILNDQQIINLCSNTGECINDVDLTNIDQSITKMSISQWNGIPKCLIYTTLTNKLVIQNGSEIFKLVTLEEMSTYNVVNFIIPETTKDEVYLVLKNNHNKHVNSQLIFI